MHFPSMQDDFQRQLAEADKAVRIALALAQAQERAVERMRAEGLKTSHAEAILAAYRHGVHLAVRRRAALEAVVPARQQGKGQ